MNVEEKIQALLVGSVALVALVPAARIRTTGDWQGISAPYIIHGPVAVSPVECHGGQTALRIWDNYQVSVYGISGSAARAIVNTVILALNGYHDVDVGRLVFKNSVPFDFDSDLKVAHIAVDFAIAATLT